MLFVLQLLDHTLISLDSGLPNSEELHFLFLTSEEVHCYSLSTLTVEVTVVSCLTLIIQEVHRFFFFAAFRFDEMRDERNGEGLSATTDRGNKGPKSISWPSRMQTASTVLRILMRRQHRRKCRCLPTESDTRYIVDCRISLSVCVGSDKIFHEECRAHEDPQLKKVLAAPART